MILTRKRSPSAMRGGFIGLTSNATSYRGEPRGLLPRKLQCHNLAPCEGVGGFTHAIDIITAQYFSSLPRQVVVHAHHTIQNRGTGSRPGFACRRGKTEEIHFVAAARVQFCRLD